MGLQTSPERAILWMVVSFILCLASVECAPEKSSSEDSVDWFEDTEETLDTNKIENTKQIVKSLKTLQKDVDLVLSNQIIHTVGLIDEERFVEYAINIIPSSCATLNIKATNTYYIRPYGTTKRPFSVLCDFEDNYGLGGGWTVFLRRFNGMMDFELNWRMYKNGFGDVNGEHWLGLEKIHAITRSGRHELLVLMEDFEGNAAYALYDDFKIGSEAENYNLTVGAYSGTAGDSFNGINGMKFSSPDKDNDPFMLKNCAEFMSTSWWFKECFPNSTALLTGTYHEYSDHLKTGMVWPTFRGSYYSLKSATMMVRKRA